MDVFSAPVAELVPSPWRKKWLAACPSNGQLKIMPSGYSLYDAASMIGDLKIEYSGILGSAWVLACRGGENFSWTVNGVFPWHSHPRAFPHFSLDDLLNFLRLKSPVMALFSACGMELARKTRIAWRVGGEIRKLALSGQPLLNMRIILKHLESNNISLLDIPEADIPKYLGIKIFYQAF